VGLPSDPNRRGYMRHKARDSVRVIATTTLIRSLLQINGVTIPELARRVGVAKSTAHDFVSGRMVTTSMDTAARYAEALRVQPDALFCPMRSTLADVEPAA
jgi:transcriptional regulator with XRE-family HTH domain